EGSIRAATVTGVQTCALPISVACPGRCLGACSDNCPKADRSARLHIRFPLAKTHGCACEELQSSRRAGGRDNKKEEARAATRLEIGRASCREKGEDRVGGAEG